MKPQNVRGAAAVLSLILMGSLGTASTARAQAPTAPAVEPGSTIDLSVERLIDLTLNNSFEIQFLNMQLRQTQLRLQAERARLRSNVSLDLSVPTFTAESEARWNSDLGRNEIVSENSRRWEAELSIRQPLIVPFLGYPTNGYFSLNNRVYRYSQIDADGESDLTYYNQYFVRYTQPLFQANSLKNDLEGAELDLEDSQIDFNEDMMGIVEDAQQEHLRLFQNAYQQKLQADYVANLERALTLAERLAGSDPSRAIEPDQVRVELGNARERLQSQQSEFRLSTARLKTEFSLPESVVISVEPEIDFAPVEIDVEEATSYALELTPRLRQLRIQQRQGEMRFDESRGRGGFRMDLAFTYGREGREPQFRDLWREPSNTYTVDVNAYVPIWDWGERKARIQAEEINLRRTDLNIDQAQIQIVSSIQNEIRNVQELQDRMVAMQSNMGLASDIADQSLERYGQGVITALDLMRSLGDEQNTGQNYLSAYASWRRTMNQLQQMTYWDFETDQAVLNRYGMGANASNATFCVGGVAAGC